MPYPTPAVVAGLTLAGATTAEATTVSTSLVDIVTVSVSIAVGLPFLVGFSGRKTVGAADDVRTGLKLNATITANASSNAFKTWGSTATNQVESGSCLLYIGPRVANYLRGTTGAGTSEGAGGGTTFTTRGTATADMPAAPITDVIINGLSDNALVTLGVAEVFVFALPTS